MSLLDSHTALNRYQTLTGNRISMIDTTSIYIAYKNVLRISKTQLMDYLDNSDIDKNHKYYQNNLEYLMVRFEINLDKIKTIHELEELLKTSIETRFHTLFNKSIEKYMLSY